VLVQAPNVLEVLPQNSHGTSPSVAAIASSVMSLMSARGSKATAKVFGTEISLPPSLLSLAAVFVSRWLASSSSLQHRPLSSAWSKKQHQNPCYWPLGDVVTASARRDNRKSKFGLPHGIKLIELYAMTKSEF
jgi:hypothetical protein